MNGLAILIAGGLGIAVVLAVRFIVIPLIDAPEGKHAESSDSGYPSWGQMPPEIAHERRVPVPQYLPAPWPGDGFRAALAMNKRAEDEDMGPRAGTPVPGYNSRLPDLPPMAKADSPAPADVPGPEVGTADTRDGDPVTVARDDPAAAVERLSPDTLPPPPVTDVPGQPGGDPAAAASTASAPPPVTSPSGAALAAEIIPPAWRAAVAERAERIKAVRAMPVDGYLATLQAATAWEDREPFTDWLSGDTLARGIPAVKL